MPSPQKTTKCLSCHITAPLPFMYEVFKKKKTGIEHLPNTFSHKVLCSHLTLTLREIQLPAKGEGGREREGVKNPKHFKEACKLLGITSNVTNK